MIKETIFPFQKRLLESQKKIVAFISGTGAGKTWIGAIRLGLWALQPDRPGAIYYAVGPTRSHLKTFLWYELIQFLTRIGLRERVDYDYNRSDLVITMFRSGARIMGKSAEVPGSLQGGHICGAVLDEAGMYDREIYHVAKQRISLYNGRLILVTTPYEWNWLKKEVYDPWLAGETEDVDVIQVDSIENPFFSREAYETAFETLPRWRFDMFFRGRFTRPAGLIYERYFQVKLPQILPHWRKWAGLDYGFTNATAGVLFTENPSDNQIYVIDCFKESRLTLEAIAKRLESWDCRVYIDPAAAGMGQELRNRGISVESAKNDVISGIALTEDLLRNKKVLIGDFPQVDKFLDEIGSYSWQTDANGDPVEKVSKVNDHLMDALRYGLVMGSETRLLTPALRPIIEKMSNRREFLQGWGKY